MNENEMEKTYQPKLFEARWQRHWEENDDFKAKVSSVFLPHKTYCIMLPPPNVTGSLHMGHGFQHTLMDMLVRYHRMRGFTVLWQGGTDHAGIATQLVVERQLEQRHLSRESLGREKFLEEVWAWKQQSGGKITQQMRQMGASIDWSRERFTMDEGFNLAVKKAFTTLYHDKLIYRGKRLVNWDIKLQSAVSDLEVMMTEEAGYLWHINYPLQNSLDYVTVATTRPETLFGDVAVAVHPDDPRYQHLIGQYLCLPLTDRKIPVIADAYVSLEFGSGCVKITPAHDFNDYEIAKRHDLLPAMINILNKDGTLNDHTPYNKMEKLAARKKILAALEEKALLQRTEKYTHKVPRCERTGEIIEPFLTDQWYVSMKPLAKKAIAAFNNGEIKFVPENWAKTYLQWLENIDDWCISRQLWWGHRIPAYFDQAGNIFVGEDAEQRKDLTQDQDVLDTWFSSALWPFATLGWPKDAQTLKDFYPTNVLVTGFDIIFFWVARMIMFGLYFMDQVPFKEIYMTGLIRDRHGQKMSKSKGNVLDPIDLVEGITLPALIAKRTFGLLNPQMTKNITQQTQKEFPEGIQAYGADALRMTFCALANTGRDIQFDLGRIGGYRNFCNKLWNAARFVLGKIKVPQEYPQEQSFSIFDAWILSRLQKTIQTVEVNFALYRFDLIAQILHDFVWHDYCDWYLEFTKIQANAAVLLKILENILKLLHPVMPFMTEEIWQKMNPARKSSLQVEFYPVIEKNLMDDKAEESITFLKNIVIAIRNIRSEMRIPPAQKITVLLYRVKNSEEARRSFEVFFLAIAFLTRAVEVKWTISKITEAAFAVVDDLEIFVTFEVSAGSKVEIERLLKEQQKVFEEIEKSRHKLANAAYLSKAPGLVVEKEKKRLEENLDKHQKIQFQLGHLKFSAQH